MAKNRLTCTSVSSSVTTMLLLKAKTTDYHPDNDFDRQFRYDL
jgi:hypothetical protein